MEKGYSILNNFLKGYYFTRDIRERLVRGSGLIDSETAFLVSLYIPAEQPSKAVPLLKIYLNPTTGEEIRIEISDAFYQHAKEVDPTEKMLWVFYYNIHRADWGCSGAVDQGYAPDNELRIGGFTGLTFVIAIKKRSSTKSNNVQRS